MVKLASTSKGSGNQFESRVISAADSSMWLDGMAALNEIDRTGFYILPEKDVLKISVMEITESVSFDRGMNAVPNGFHDPVFGSTKPGETCVTCSMNYSHCPGHFGHIKLCTNLFNPLLFDLTYQLLRGSCFSCHRFYVQGNELQIRLLEAGLEALREGDMCLAAEIEKINLSSSIDSLFAPNDGALAGRMTLKSRMESRLIELQTELKAMNNDNVQWPTSRNLVAMRRKLLTNFCNHFLFKRPAKCPHCQAVQLGFRVEKKRVILMSMKGRQSTGKKSRNVVDSAEPPVHCLDGNREDFGVNLGLLVASGKRLLQPSEVRNHLRMVWRNGGDKLLSIVFPMFQHPVNTPKDMDFVPTDILFIRSVLVMPPRFRPVAEMMGRKFENPETLAFRRLMDDSIALKKLVDDTPGNSVSNSHVDQEERFRAMASLQMRLNMLFDSEAIRTIGQSHQGLRQILEKKEGLFRKHMMGKRVNFAGRTVITPDPYIDVDCVGIPEVFAKKLTFPEQVFPANAMELSRAVINGANQLIGANVVSNEEGAKVSLAIQSRVERMGIAKRLLQKSYRFGGKQRPKVVYRHMKEGDVVLINRQPTLHKPSIMAHKVKILRNQQTIRLNYANCKTFNADFDGDEMNVHFPQSYLTRAECQEIACTPRQYLVPKDGKPISGLIQDHVVSGFLLTLRDRFFSREDYQYLLLSSFGQSFDKLKLLPPSILKPQRLWTGKQVISSVLLSVIPDGYPMFMLEGRAKTSERNWKLTGRDGCNFEMSESCFIIRNGQLLCGVMDKAQFGASAYGLVHCVYELYGPFVASMLLSSFSRLFTTYMQMHGFTLGIQDILLTRSASKKRKKIASRLVDCAEKVIKEAVGLVDTSAGSLRDHFEAMNQNKERADELAQVLHKMRLETDALNDEANKVCFPDGLEKKFPKNALSLMIESGAKGTSVNQFQMSCMLGQVDLEGGVIPAGLTGRTLPSFRRFDVSPRSRGFVCQRFLAGLQPQEFFFHCLAGREGLIDTAVKTSRSGYLQRCLIKHLEGLVANYDLSVRDSDGSIIQFVYGEDGMDVTKAQYFGKAQLPMLRDNIQVLRSLSRCPKMLDDGQGIKAFRKVKDWKKRGGKSGSRCSFFSFLPAEVQGKSYDCLKEAWFELKEKDRVQYRHHQWMSSPDTPMASLSAVNRLGVLSEKCLSNFDSLSEELSDRGLKKDASDFTKLMFLKGLASFVDPGEAVGLLAAQSIGEPSTQMTLNTFHFAGRGEMNVTLGIPRLREILMTASENIRAPTTSVTFLDGITRETAEDTRRKISRIYLSQVLDRICINEYVTTVGEKCREYDILLKFMKRKRRPYSTRHLKCEHIVSMVEKSFFKEVCLEVKKLCDSVAMTRKTQVQLDSAVEGADEAETYEESTEVITTIGQQENDTTDEDEADPDDDATLDRRKQRRNDETEYVGEDEEIEMMPTDENNDEIGDLVFEDEDSMPKAETSRIDQCRVKSVVEGDVWIADYQYDGKRSRWCRATIKVPLCHGAIDVLYLVKAQAEKFLIQYVKGIKRCFLNEQDGKLAVITEGVNLKVFFNRPDVFDVNSIRSNDLCTMQATYGIEATVQAIIRVEVKNVFGCYGIDVDNRHLSLLSDYMTYTGAYQPFNRTYMNTSTSPLQKMTFETALSFLRDAIINATEDELKTPSSDILIGRLPHLGTGYVDLIATQ